jgi:UDP-glucose 4-epimerase
MFNSKIKYLPKRAGERYVSALITKNLSNKIYKHYGKINLKNYIEEFLGRSN